MSDDEIPQLLMGTPMVPVTIISGFLGSGKTTLLHYILTAQHGKRIAVIENEFGEEIGVEKLIAKDGIDGNVLQDFYELSNGCICCSVRDDLINTLERLLEKRDRFDYILIETTGMANPGKVASLFWVDDELEGRIYLDGIVTLVDSQRIEFLLDNHDTQMETSSQIAYADRLLLNKQDLIEPSRKNAIEVRVQCINRIAECQWTERAQVDLDYILNIQSFTTQRAQDVEELLKSSYTKGVKHLHTGGIQTTCIALPNGWFDRNKLERWLGELLWEQTERATQAQEASQPIATYFRIKGVIATTENRAYKYVLQAVHELFEVYPTKETWQLSEEQVSSRIVFIGLCLDPVGLETGLRQCLEMIPDE